MLVELLSPGPVEILLLLLTTACAMLRMLESNRSATTNNKFSLFSDPLNDRNLQLCIIDDVGSPQR